MIKFKVLKGHFFSGVINGSAPNEVEIADESTLIPEQLRDIVEGYLNGVLEFEDKNVVSELAKQYLTKKGVEGDGVVHNWHGLLELLQEQLPER